MEHITLRSAHCGIRETATVRQCARRGLKHAIGAGLTSDVALAGQGRKLWLETVQPSAAPRP